MRADLEYLREKITKCVDEFYLNESGLLERENYEVTISSKLAQYIFNEFPRYDVDCEYNKHLDGEKKVDELNQNIRPDIIIHRRGTDENNLVYIEIKTDHNRELRTHDYDKIKAMTKQKEKYRYSLGLFIDFNRDKEKLNIKYFEDGKECN